MDGMAACHCQYLVYILHLLSQEWSILLIQRHELREKEEWMKIQNLRKRQVIKFYSLLVEESQLDHTEAISQRPNSNIKVLLLMSVKLPSYIKYLKLDLIFKSNFYFKASLNKQTLCFPAHSH